MLGKIQELIKIGITDLQKTSTCAEVLATRLSAELTPIGSRVQDVVFPKTDQLSLNKTIVGISHFPTGHVFNFILSDASETY